MKRVLLWSLVFGALTAPLPRNAAGSSGTAPPGIMEWRRSRTRASTGWSPTSSTIPSSSRSAPTDFDHDSDARGSISGEPDQHLSQTVPCLDPGAPAMGDPRDLKAAGHRSILPDPQTPAGFKDAAPRSRRRSHSIIPDAPPVRARAARPDRWRATGGPPRPARATTGPLPTRPATNSSRRVSASSSASTRFDGPPMKKVSSKRLSPTSISAG